MSSDVHLRAISLDISQPSVTKISLKSIFLRFYWNLPGANELNSFLMEDNKIPLLELMLLLVGTWWCLEPGHQQAWCYFWWGPDDAWSQGISRHDLDPVNLRYLKTRHRRVTPVVIIHRWLSARLQYLQCVSNGDIAVLYYAIEWSCVHSTFCLMKQ